MTASHDIVSIAYSHYGQNNQSRQRGVNPKNLLNQKKNKSLTFDLRSNKKLWVNGFLLFISHEYIQTLCRSLKWRACCKKRIVSKIDNKNKTKIHKWGTRKGKFLSKRNKKNIALRAASAASIIGLFIFWQDSLLSWHL